MFMEMITPPIMTQQVEVEAPFIFDMKLGDVTGDQVDDFIYLAGDKESLDAIYQENLTLYIVDGVTNETLTEVLPLKGGYEGMLFVGDFNQDFVEDVYVSIESGSSINTNYYYLYSFKDKKSFQLFDYEMFNLENQWQVTFLNQFKMELTNQLNQTFLLDISKKDPRLLAQYYHSDGSVKNQVKGEVLSLGGLVPMVRAVGNESYDLVATQRIIGEESNDYFGLIQTYLTFNNQTSYPYEVMVGDYQVIQ